MPAMTKDYISPHAAMTLHGLFSERVKRSSGHMAYRYFDHNLDNWNSCTWEQADAEVNRWHHGLSRTGLTPGDRVGVMLRNCPEWVFFEQAALRAGLVLVPLFPNDRPDNIAHIINQSDVKLLLIENQPTLDTIRDAAERFDHALGVICLQRASSNHSKLNIESVTDFLPHAESALKPLAVVTEANNSNDLATIVYTSGTTGLPKGVMLSHWNILSNAYSGLQSVTVYHEDLFLSFLPLSHTLERTVGCYIPIMTGASVAFARSIPELAEDLQFIKPTVLISVPRIFERVRGRILDQLEAKPPIARKLFRAAMKVGWQRFEIQQRRASWSPAQLLWPILKKLVAQKIMDKLGGRMRFAICGGAPLSEPVARLFIGLGLPVIQGYGLTEASPIISVNPLDNNIPDSIGIRLQGVEVRLAEDGELQTQSESVMLGYWQNEQATAETFTDDGWLKTGDLAAIKGDHIFITGRKKEILVLSNGEKVPPADIEMAITLDALFEQALVIGEARPCLAALIVLNPEEWEKVNQTHQLGEDINGEKAKNFFLTRIGQCMHQFPGYAKIHQIHVTLEPWSDENGLLTPSLKMRRKPICDKFAQAIEDMYSTDNQAKNQ